MKRGRASIDYVKDILEYCAVAQELLGAMSLEQFTADRRTHLAVIRTLEVIGEAARRVSGELRRRYPEVPWEAAVGMRNKVIHGYFGVDLRVVWLTVLDDLPVLQIAMARVLKELEQGERDA